MHYLETPYLDECQGDSDSVKTYPREFDVPENSLFQTEWPLNHQLFNQICHRWLQAMEVICVYQN